MTPPARWTFPTARVRAALATMVFVLSLAPAAARADDVVVIWMDLTDWALEQAWESDRNFRKATNTRAGAQVALAMFEAVNAIDRRYTSYLGGITAPSGASADAAAAQAAHTVLVAMVPAQKDALDQALALSLSTVTDSAARVAGVDVGRRAAAAAMARAALPAGHPLAAYRPRTAPGAYIDPGLPSIYPFDLAMPPFVLDSAAEIRPEPPPALTSARYARDLDEVRRLGARESADRPATKTALAPALLGLDYAALLRDVARQAGRTPVQNARMYALFNMAGEDGWLAVMEAKMHFGTWRPITAIRNADQDGNDATTEVPEWEPLLRTPTHPDYPCGHCVWSAATAVVLEAETGPAPAGGIQLRSVDHSPGHTITVPTWTAFVDEMSMSRIYAGAHTRAANEVAEAMGRTVARRALATLMRPLTSAAH